MKAACDKACERADFEAIWTWNPADDIARSVKAKTNPKEWEDDDQFVHIFAGVVLDNGPPKPCSVTFADCKTVPGNGIEEPEIFEQGQ